MMHVWVEEGEGLTLPYRCCDIARMLLHATIS